MSDKNKHDKHFITKFSLFLFPITPCYIFIDILVAKKKIEELLNYTRLRKSYQEVC